MLDCVGVTIRGRNYYGQSSGPIVSYFYCGGTENSLFECNTRYLTNSISCNHDQDIGLDCECKYNYHEWYSPVSLRINYIFMHAYFFSTLCEWISKAGWKSMELSGTS